MAIPEGYELKYSLGTETIIRTEKGMVIQRAEGIKHAKSKNILVVDDDVEFGPNFIQELDSYMNIYHLDCVLPMAGQNSDKNATTIDLWYPWLIRLRSGFTGQMFQTSKKSDYLDVITVTAGHKVFCGNNKLDQCYYCQTGNFQCFYCNTEKAQNVHFENEIWLQQGSLSSYAAYDDAAFFFQFFLQGNTIAYALRTRYIHLDSGTGRVAKDRIEAKRIRYFTISRNRTLFWYRFLYQTSTSLSRKILVVLGGLYAITNYTVYTILINIHPKYWKAINALLCGYREAFDAIRSKSIKPLGLSYEKRIENK